MSERNMEYNYRWTLGGSDFKKDRGKVFSCFACGGGSTMGYKLAGFDVIGFNEIDPRMADIYTRNHNPKYFFVEAIQDFVKWGEFPEELYHLHILDGSPPCSSFSMVGRRERDWGKTKKFREGQAEQVLDTLFFDFIELARRLRPKVVVAENVEAILFGNAIEYAKAIVGDFRRAGYAVKEYVIRAMDMGVPQRRERIFFICVREDLMPLLPIESGLLFSDFPALDLRFTALPIPFKAIKTDGLNDMPWTDHDEYVWRNRRRGDRNYSDALRRIEDRHSNYNSIFIYNHKIVPTLTSSDASRWTLFDEQRRMNTVEMMLAQSFPLDYDFVNFRPKYPVRIGHERPAANDRQHCRCDIPAVAIIVPARVRISQEELQTWFR